MNTKEVIRSFSELGDTLSAGLWGVHDELSVYRARQPEAVETHNLSKTIREACQQMLSEARSQNDAEGIRVLQAVEQINDKITHKIEARSTAAPATKEEIAQWLLEIYKDLQKVAVGDGRKSPQQ